MRISGWSSDVCSSDLKTPPPGGVFLGPRFSIQIPPMPTASPKNTSSTRFAFLLVFLIGALVYAKGLFGGFLFDDYPNIVNNAALQAVAQHQGSWLAVAESSKSGPLHKIGRAHV